MVIALLPALIPAFVTLTVFVGSAFVIVKPVLSSFDAPVVTLVTFKFGLSLTCTPVAVAVVVIFGSPVTATASPSFLIPVVPLSPVNVNPLLSTAVLASVPALISVFVAADRSKA